MASKRSPGRITTWRTMLVLAAAAIALLAAGAAVAASRGSSSEADRLRAIEQTRLQALVDADTATARKLIAPDFQLINPGGGVSGREDYMDALEAGVIDYRVFEPASPIAVRLS
jgi:ABC-type glycerol-3-phosphate transport system substrate-binding protein